ncbi:diguanylate cyclase, partial [Escherichia coli]|nr:diguanylate cyclase [Escherichia coli]MCV5339112.1 diguanylate cyclase [Escherichia coli]MCV5386848.1 diguanylate cyclase [Escherichia coli]
DRNRSHWSTSKTPSYTKSVSWQHHPANDEEACRAGVRICQLVDNHAITHSEGHINITVTAGVSRAFPEEPLDVVIGRADRAMYEGKQTGRNRCMFIDEQNVINRV